MLSELCKQLIDHYQHGLPLCERPYAEMAAKLNVTESEVMESLTLLNDLGILSRIGIVFNHRKMGASTLAAIRAPEHQIEQIADIISSYKEVNHNYLRENPINLWFVVAASNKPELDAVVKDMQARTGLKVLCFPMETAYHIDLGFRKDWDQIQHVMVT